MVQNADEVLEKDVKTKCCWAKLWAKCMVLGFIFR